MSCCVVSSKEKKIVASGRRIGKVDVHVVLTIRLGLKNRRIREKEREIGAHVKYWKIIGWVEEGQELPENNAELLG